MSMFFSYFELAASLFILLMAFTMFNRHYENRAARFFARFALIGFLAALFEYSLRIAFTLDAAKGVNRISIIFWLFTFAMFLHFVLVFTKKDGIIKQWWKLVIFYTPAIILGLVFVFSDIMYSYYEIGHIGIISQPSPYYLAFTLYTAIYVGIGAILLFWYAVRATQKIVREQSLLIAFGCLIPAIVGIVADEIFPIIFHTRILWPTAVFDLAIMNFFVYIAMRQYSLFAISPALAADIIIETMPDSLIVTDLEGRIIMLNEEAHKFFHAPKEEILGKPIYDLFVDKTKYEKLFSEVVDKNLEIERFEAELCDPLGECIHGLINANKLRDAFRATLGVVYIIRDSRG